MGYRGKVEAQEKARDMRAEGRTLLDIATVLGVSKSSVSVWVRDVAFEAQPRRASAHRRPHAQHLAKLAEIDECDRLGVERIGRLSDDAFSRPAPRSTPAKDRSATATSASRTRIRR